MDLNDIEKGRTMQPEIKVIHFSKCGVDETMHQNESLAESASCECGAKNGNCPFEDCALFNSLRSSSREGALTDRNKHIYPQDSLLSLYTSYGKKKATYTAEISRLRKLKTKKKTICKTSESSLSETEIETEIEEIKDTLTPTSETTKSFQCRNCAQSFATNMKLMYHVRKIHPKLAQKMKAERIRNRTCSKCSKVFNNQLSADYHINNQVCAQEYESEDKKFPAHKFRKINNQAIGSLQKSLMAVSKRKRVEYVTGDRSRCKSEGFNLITERSGPSLKRERIRRISQNYKFSPETRKVKRLKTSEDAQMLSPYQMKTTYEDLNTNSTQEISPTTSKSGRIIKPKVSFDTMLLRRVNLYKMNKKKNRPKRI